MLTAKQKKLLEFIHAETRKSNGICPSYEEMRAHMDIKSKSGIHTMIGALENRGFISRIPNCARSIEVLRMPMSLRAYRAETTQAAPDPTRQSRAA